MDRQNGTDSSLEIDPNDKSEMIILFLFFSILALIFSCFDAFCRPSTGSLSVLNDEFKQSDQELSSGTETENNGLLLDLTTAHASASERPSVEDKDEEEGRGEGR